MIVNNICQDITFSFSECCRSSSINNLQNPGGLDTYYYTSANPSIGQNQTPILTSSRIAIYCLNQLAFFKGLSMTTPINASIIMTVNPIIVVTLAYLAKQEKITYKKIVGILIAGTSAYFFLTKGVREFTKL